MPSGKFFLSFCTVGWVAPHGALEWSLFSPGKVTRWRFSSNSHSSVSGVITELWEETYIRMGISCSLREIITVTQAFSTKPFQFQLLWVAAALTFEPQFPRPQLEIIIPTAVTCLYFCNWKELLCLRRTRRNWQLCSPCFLPRFMWNYRHWAWLYFPCMTKCSVVFLAIPCQMPWAILACMSDECYLL